MTMGTAQEVINALNLVPHPEGGYFREIYRAPKGDRGAREAVTSIYFLLEAGKPSHWHKVDAVEIWNYHAGAPLKLSISECDQGPVIDVVLGADIVNGETPQGVVPKNAWQTAKTLGDWTLTGCQVAPGFEFAGFTLAKPDWSPTPDMQS